MMTKCSTKGCHADQKVKGMCKKHYNAAWHKANPGARASWHRAHPEATANWHKANPGVTAAWHKANPEYISAWREVNTAKINANAARLYATKKKRMPAWADHDKIDNWYEAAAHSTEASGIPHEVDHIIPLHGKLVSGLHIDYNMQILTKNANQRKRNKFEVI